MSHWLYKSVRNPVLITEFNYFSSLLSIQVRSVPGLPWTENSSQATSLLWWSKMGVHLLAVPLAWLTSLFWMKMTTLPLSPTPDPTGIYSSRWRWTTGLYPVLQCFFVFLRWMKTSIWAASFSIVGDGGASIWDSVRDSHSQRPRWRRKRDGPLHSIRWVGLQLQRILEVARVPTNNARK